MPNETHEPLMPDPNWRQVNSPNWISDKRGGSLSSPPSAYALGVEEGAYALAKKVFDCYRTGDVQGAINMLLKYNNGTAHPVKGWEHEPPRN